MRKIIILASVAATLFSCGPKESAVISLNVNGASDKEVVLSKLSVNKIGIVDTLKLNAEGSAKYKVNVGEQTPDFFYLSYNRKRIASLLLKGGDNVKVSVDTTGKNLVVEGSDESVLLEKIEQKVYDFTVKFDSLSYLLIDAVDAKNDKRADELQRELGSLFIKYKRAAVADIMRNPYSMTNVNLLYQRLNENLPLFGDVNDIAYFKRVYDSLSVAYPKSVYVKSLEEEIGRFENLVAMNNKIKQANELAFPELSLPDTQSKVQKLSDMYGKPFILIFWSSAVAEQKMFNHELKELYSKYAPKGLGIYQVSVDVDKAMWATVVKEQQLPWINVCDGLGNASIAVNTYAVTTVPTMYVFDKNGNIVAKNLFTKAALDRELGKLSY